MQSLRLFLVSALVLVPVGVGCGDPPPMTIPSDGGGRRDAQVDASRPNPEDAGAPADGGDAAIDGGGGFDPTTCRLDPATDVLTLGTDSPARAQDVGIAAGASSAAVVWAAGDGFLDEVLFAEVTDTGSVSAIPVTSLGAVTRDPVVAPNGTGWMLAWYGNADADFDVYAQAWRGAAADGAVQRLTERTGRDDAPALLATATGTFAAWVEERDPSQRVAVA
nr:hypothetical protein [Myxococcota bacterium]